MQLRLPLPKRRKKMQAERSKEERINIISGNAGFSLIEVLVAMIILAIVVIPLLKGFVVTQKVNGRAQRLESAQAVAQNVMEALKPATLEEIAQQFNSTDSEGFTLLKSNVGNTQFFFQPDTGNNGSCLRKEIPGAVSKSCSVNSAGKFIGQSTNKYQFAIKGVYENSKYYDVRIDIDASHYRNTAGSSDTRDSSAAAYNSIPYSYVASYSQQKDYMFLQKLTDEQEVYQQIRVGLGNAALTDADIGKYVQRTITVDIEGSNPVTVNTTVTYHYLGKTVSGSVDQTRVYASGSYVQTDGTDAVPRNVFLCYTPDYYSNSSNNSARGGIYLDNIIVNNNNGLPVNLVIVKQKTDTDDQIQTLEQNYRVKVSINEKNIRRTAAAASEHTKLRTNLNTNIAQTDSTSAVTGTYPYQTCFVYSASNASASGNMNAMSSYLEIRALDGAAGETNTMYDTEISVYDSGEYDKGFPAADKPLLTIYGDDNRRIS